MTVLLRCTILLTTVSVLASVVLAQDAQPPSPPMSADCQTSASSVSEAHPLAHVAAAIRDRKAVKILAIGATGRVGLDGPRGGYQDIIEATLEKILPGVSVEIIDRGISGELARDAKERMKVEVALTGPDIVLWQVGTNDALARIPPEDVEATTSSAVQWLKAHEIDVVLVGLHYVRSLKNDQHYQAIRSAINRVAEAEKVLKIGRYEAMEAVEQARRLSGRTAPNEFAQTEAGYTCLADYVVRAITAGVFTKRPPRKS